MGTLRPVFAALSLGAWMLAAGAADGLAEEQPPAKAPVKAPVKVRAPASGGATPTELALAKGARPSVARVRLRDRRFGDLTMTRHAIVVRRDGLFLMAGPPPGRGATVTVVLRGGRELRARQVGHDAETALTLLRVSTTGLIPLAGAAPRTGTNAARPAPSTAGRTRTLPPIGARLVMVTGDGAVAVGPVRAHNRVGSLRDPDRRRSVHTTGLVGVALAAIDTDAGAPLLDAAGRLAGLLVGRKATIAPAVGEAAARQGLTLRPTPVEAVIVPRDVVRLVWPLLERHGRVPRAGLGIDTQGIDESLREHLGLTTGGHVIQRVTPGGPAARHGLRRHDVIVSVGGRNVPPGTRLHDLLLPFRPRATVRLGLIRAGERLTVSVVLGERRVP